MGREDETRRDGPPFEFGGVWPDDEPFPPGDAEYTRLVQGHPGALGKA